MTCSWIGLRFRTHTPHLHPCSPFGAVPIVPWKVLLFKPVLGNGVGWRQTRPNLDLSSFSSLCTEQLQSRDK